MHEFVGFVCTDLAEVIEKKASTNDEAEYYVHYSERTDRTGLLLLSSMFHNV